MSTAERLAAMGTSSVGSLSCVKPYMGGAQTCNGYVPLGVACTSCYHNYTEELLLHHSKQETVKVSSML